VGGGRGRWGKEGDVRRNQRGRMSRTAGVAHEEGEGTQAENDSDLCTERLLVPCELISQLFWFRRQEAF